MPMSEKGSNWLLVLTDHFTSWAEALVIPDVSAHTVTFACQSRYPLTLAQF